MPPIARPLARQGRANAPTHRRAGTVASLVVALVAGVLTGVTGPSPTAAALPTNAAPDVTVTKVAGDLTIPWDLTWVGDVMIFGERGGRLWSQRGSAAPRRVDLGALDVYAVGEAGLLGLVADPAAASNGYFYSCHAVRAAGGGAGDVQVWKWKLTSDTAAVKIRVLIKGIALKESGRHSGCRLRFRSARALYVGTGDAATGTNPQSLTSLAGKVLRVRSDGSIPTSNPFYKRGGNARYIWSYGHRNIQGLIKRPGIDEIWSVEHGPDRDDEINRIWKGRNYGWAPTPGYNESRPMTDKDRFPKANGPKWRSGFPTVATSGGSFISGSQWGSWNGRLAVAMLKGKGIKLFTVNSATRISGSQTLFTSYGRIRTVQQGPDGLLYFTTSNGSGNDGIYAIAPG